MGKFYGVSIFLSYYIDIEHSMFLVAFMHSLKKNKTYSHLIERQSARLLTIYARGKVFDIREAS